VLGEGHGIVKGGEAFSVIAGEALRVQAVEVVAAQLAVRLAVPQDVVGDDEEAMGDRDDGLLVPTAFPRRSAARAACRQATGRFTTTGDVNRHRSSAALDGAGYRRRTARRRSLGERGEVVTVYLNR
jgi:hypothetical protein